MKKNIIITLILLIIYIIINNQGIFLLKQKDNIMIKIKNNKNKNPINAIITQNTIIPGLNGYKINYNKSYKKMKKINNYNENLLVKEIIKPKYSITNNYNKQIIQGNIYKNNISIIINDNINLEELNNILIKNNIEISLITNKNIKLSNIKELLSENYTNNITYCISNKININKNCLQNKKYTILNKNIIQENYIENTKKVLKNGSIINYIFTKDNIQTLNIIIKYIKLNNYNIVPIKEIIKE